MIPPPKINREKLSAAGCLCGALGTARGHDPERLSRRPAGAVVLRRLSADGWESMKRNRGKDRGRSYDIFVEFSNADKRG